MDGADIVTVNNSVSGYEVYRSDEFKALCKRFGIRWEHLTINITLTLTVDLFTVTSSYLVQAPSMVDTTTLDNEKYRTKRPPINVKASP